MFYYSVDKIAHLQLGNPAASLSHFCQSSSRITIGRKYRIILISIDWHRDQE